MWVRPERCIEYTRCIPVITANNTYFFNFACIEYLVIFMFVVVCSALQRPCLCQGYWSVPKSFSLSAYPPEHLRPVRERRISRVFSLSGSAASTLSKLSDWNAEDNKQTRSLQYKTCKKMVAAKGSTTNIFHHLKTHPVGYGMKNV